MNVVESLYRDVDVPFNWHMTSQNPGQGWSAAIGLNIRANFDKILSYQHPGVVGKIMENLKMDSAEAENLFTDVKRYLFMAALQDHPTIPSPTIDEGWHAFVLFTKDYAEFCQNMFGGFLHHQPHQPSDPDHKREDVFPTIDDMHRVFGGKPSSNWDYHLVAA